MFFYVKHKALGNLRKRRKLSQKTVALRGGFDMTALSKWESGERRPEDDRLPDLCRGLGCSQIQFWKECVRLQNEYYTELASLEGEEPPGMEPSPFDREIKSLLALDNADLAPGVALALSALRGTVAGLIALLEPLISQLVWLHRLLKDAGSGEPESDDAEDDQDAA